MRLEYTGDWYITPGEDNNFFFDIPYNSKQAAIEVLKTEYGSGYVGKGVLINFSFEDISVADRVIDALKEQYGDVFEDDWEFPRDLEAELNMQMAATVIDFLNLNNLNANKLGVTNIERIENDL